MLQQFGLVVLLFAFLQKVSGECANACNGHGKCTSFDMCICNRNWQAADCSERVCQFGLAHVDTPKGDLNGDGSVSNANQVLIDNNYVYPYGTTEQFPQMQNSDLATLTDTAHYYMECSNKGRCDRSTGECQCFEGYDGVACQRASCPGYPSSCSGHGVCKTIKQLAAVDNGNVYELWDKTATMGCDCDSGYFGADCSQRECKVGVDPLYLDDAATVHYSTFNVALISTDTTNTNFTYQIFDENAPGYWALRFYDSFGEDWVTQPIIAGASCAQVIDALENIPNNAVPTSSIECTRTTFTGANGTEATFSTNDAYYDAQHPMSATHPYRLVYRLALWEARTPSIFDELSPATATTDYYSSWNDSTDAVSLSGFIYLLKFYGSPGKLQQPEVDVYLDGTNPTLISQGKKVITKVWTDGQQGEYDDYFADHCAGVTVTLATQQTPLTGFYNSYLTGFTTTEKNLLKACLGGSDFNSSNNIDVYNWDYGSKLYPHMVKLIRTVTTYTDGGYYAALWYDSSGKYTDNLGTDAFRLLNPFYPPDAFSTDNYDIYTTTGTLALTSELSQATFGFASKYVYTTNVTYDVNSTHNAFNAMFNYPYDGDISCESGAGNTEKFQYIYHCLNKTDVFTLLNWEYPQYNPPHINLYTAERIFTTPYQHSTSDRFSRSNALIHAGGQYYYGPQNATEMHYLTHQITTDFSTNWGVSVSGWQHSSEKPIFHVYKFFPATASTYNYVGECSNRGICDRDTGVCGCFAGYTSDNCAEQSSLAV